MSALALQSFGFEDHLVRVLDRSGAPWFIAQDVCSCLEIVNHRHAVASLDDDEKDGVATNDVTGRQQVQTIISESGLYSLIFKSRKAASVRFRKWVTSEVLPTLRKTGSYRMAGVNKDEDVPVILPFLDTADDVDRFRSALAAVRECRIVHGRGKARRLWPVLGLPEPPAANMGVHGQISYVRDESVARWINDRVEPEPGNRCPSNDMWDDYKSYCEENGTVRSPRVAFGKTLLDFGYPPYRSGVVYRMGCRLKD